MHALIAYVRRAHVAHTRQPVHHSYLSFLPPAKTDGPRPASRHAHQSRLVGASALACSECAWGVWVARAPTYGRTHACCAWVHARWALGACMRPLWGMTSVIAISMANQLVAVSRVYHLAPPYPRTHATHTRETCTSRTHTHTHTHMPAPRTQLVLAFLPAEKYKSAARLKAFTARHPEASGPH